MAGPGPLPEKLPRKSWEVGKMTLINFKGSQYLGDFPPMDFQLNHELWEEEFKDLLILYGEMGVKHLL